MPSNFPNRSLAAGRTTLLFLIFCMLNSENQIFRYNGSPITFSQGDSVMVNATEMAKPFKKRPSKWLALPTTKQFFDTLEAVRKSDRSALVKKVNGIGTWLHEDVALEFARWLSPLFAIWCNDRIKELLRMGVTTVRNDDEAIAYAMEVLNRRLVESRRQLQAAQLMLDCREATIQALAPKAQYADEVLQSTSTYTLTQIAHDLGLRSVYALTRFLSEKHILYRQSGQWQPTAKVAGQGYFETRTAKYVKSDNTIGTSLSTVVTELGRQFLHNLINKEA